MKKALLIMALTVLVGTAQAVTFEGTAVGSWVNVDGTGTSVVSVANNDAGANATIDWGTPAFGSFTSRFTFDGVGSDGGAGFSVNNEDPFLIGNFSYRNGTINSGTGINGVDLSILLTLTSPIGVVDNYGFDFDITNTPNTTGNAVLDGDIVTVNNPLASTVFIYNDVEYTLQILGFSNDGGNTITTDFSSPEEACARAGLYAKITSDFQQLPPVPEPATISLLGLGLAGIVATRLRKRRS